MIPVHLYLLITGLRFVQVGKTARKPLMRSTKAITVPSVMARRNEKPRCDNVRDQVTSGFRKVTSGTQQRDSLLKRPSALMRPILCFSEENAEKRYTIWNSTIAAAHIR